MGLMYTKSDPIAVLWLSGCLSRQNLFTLEPYEKDSEGFPKRFFCTTENG